MFHKNIMMEKREERKENRATDSAGASYRQNFFLKNPIFADLIIPIKESQWFISHHELH